MVLRIFYPDTVIGNRERLRFDNPAILVSNHPNALMDPLHVAARARQVVFFLANASLYKTRLGNWFFSTFYCIPIQRPKDVNGQQLQNTGNFEKCDEFLTGGGTLYIAPQGGSEWKRRLDPIKSGTARIALSAENKNDFELGLTIVPVGLNYENPSNYRSKLFINVGSPIKVSDYEMEYHQHNFGAARKLTDDLEEAMKNLIIDTVDEEEDLLIRRLEAIQQNENPLPFEKIFYRTKKLLDSLREKKEKSLATFSMLKNLVTNYYATLEKQTLNDRAVKKNISPSQKITHSLLLLVGLPFFLYGWLNNLVAHFIPGWLVKKINTWAVYTSTIKVLGALIVFPLIYGLQIWGVYCWTQNSRTTLFYALSILLLGIFAWWYRNAARQFFKNIRFGKYFSKMEKENILNDRKKIISELNLLLEQTKA